MGLALSISVSCTDGLLGGDTPNGGEVSILASASGHKWVKGDAIFVTLSGGGSAKLLVDSVRVTGSAVLKGDLPKGKVLEGIAVFPYGDYRKEGSGYALTLPEEYEDVAADRAFLAAAVDKGAKHLSFSPIGGKISVSFDNIPAIATGVVFTSDGPSSGLFNLSSDNSGKFTLSPANDAGKKVRIALDGQKKSGTFVFPLPPGSYSNWTVAMEDARGNLLRFALPQSALDLRISPGTSIIKDVVSFPKFCSKVTETVYGLAESGIVSIYSDDAETVLADGVTVTDIHFTKKKSIAYGTEVRAYIVVADLSNGKNHLRLGAPSADKTKFNAGTGQKLSGMAPLYVSETSRPTVLINGDFWCINDVNNGVNTKYYNKLRGPVHYRGEIIKDTFLYEEHWSEQGLSFFGVKGDGSMILREREEYPAYKEQLEECSGAGVVFLNNGVIPDIFKNDSEDPRTAIGFHDQTFVILVVDGRKTGWSSGLTYVEMAYLMKSLGCTWAANLDGGKSSELMVLNPHSGKYEVHNKLCSDDGSERKLAEAWIIFTDGNYAE